MDATATDPKDGRSNVPRSGREDEQSGVSDGGRSSGTSEREQIIARFIRWVNDLDREFATVDSPGSAKLLEQRIRDGGLDILRLVLQERLQAGIDRAQATLRHCSRCGGTRRHRGRRSRRLDSSLGTITLQGIYWQCPDCGDGVHSVDLVSEDRLSGVLKELVLLLGIASGSFDKAEVLSQKLLGVRVDDDTIRRTCESEGQKALVRPQKPVPAGDGQMLWGSCDGAMVNVRDQGWKEVRAARFRHAGGEFALAAKEPAERFVPRMAQVARSLVPPHPGPLAFSSDCAEWIIRGVSALLPGWTHMADPWHARQHITPVAEALYGKADQGGDEMGEDFARYFGSEMICAGGAALADELRQSAMSYPDLRHQRAVLDLAKFFDKHAAQMDYPRYIREGLPVDSGPMESLCKQLGLRLKGSGMRWGAKNVGPMAYMVARWAVDPPAAAERGLQAA
jgi:hypothetical protein